RRIGLRRLPGSMLPSSLHVAARRRSVPTSQLFSASTAFGELPHGAEPQPARSARRQHRRPLCPAWGAARPGAGDSLLRRGSDAAPDQRSVEHAHRVPGAAGGALRRVAAAPQVGRRMSVLLRMKRCWLSSGRHWPVGLALLLLAAMPRAQADSYFLTV